MAVTPAASAASIAHVAQSSVSAVHAASEAASTAPGWLESGSLSFELVKGLPAALVALIIGAIAAWIAWHQLQVAREQKRVAKAKFNFDLFHERYEVFEATWSVLSAMIQGAHDQAERDAAFHNIRPRARFLFGAEIADYMAEISWRMADQRTIDAVTRQRGDVMRPEDIERYAANSNFFADEASKGARDRFGQYLDFSEWR
jgi:hypothetical protein